MSNSIYLQDAVILMCAAIGNTGSRIIAVFNNFAAAEKLQASLETFVSFMEENFIEDGKEITIKDVEDNIYTMLSEHPKFVEHLKTTEDGKDIIDYLRAIFFEKIEYSSEYIEFEIETFSNDVYCE